MFRKRFSFILWLLMPGFLTSPSLASKILPLPDIVNMYIQSNSCEVPNVKEILKVTPPQYVSNCGTDYIKIHYSPDQKASSLLICQGFERALSYMGFLLDYEFNEPLEVFIGEAGSFTDKYINLRLEHAAGLYHDPTNTLIMKPWESLKQEKYLEYLPYSKNLYSSVATHEMIHHIHYTHTENMLNMEALKNTITPALFELKSVIEKQLWDYPETNGVLLLAIDQVEKKMKDPKLKYKDKTSIKAFQDSVEQLQVAVQLAYFRKKREDLDYERAREKINEAQSQISAKTRSLVSDGLFMETETLAYMIQMETLEEPDKSQLIQFLSQFPSSFNESNITRDLFDLGHNKYLYAVYNISQNYPDITSSKASLSSSNERHIIEKLLHSEISYPDKPQMPEYSICH